MHVNLINISKNYHNGFNYQKSIKDMQCRETKRLNRISKIKASERKERCKRFLSCVIYDAQRV